MPTQKKIRRLQKDLQKELRRENIRLRKLKLTNPEMFRRCGDVPCCQATNEDGSYCSRPALTDKSYIEKVRCCYLCWQHALSFGVYLTYKLAKLAGTAHLDWDSYCALYPEECDVMLKRIGQYE